VTALPPSGAPPKPILFKLELTNAEDALKLEKIVDPPTIAVEFGSPPVPPEPIVTRTDEGRTLASIVNVKNPPPPPPLP
jgi:hypothetical protein